MIEQRNMVVSWWFFLGYNFENSWPCPTIIQSCSNPWFTVFPPSTLGETQWSWCNDYYPVRTGCTKWESLGWVFWWLSFFFVCDTLPSQNRHVWNVSVSMRNTSFKLFQPFSGASEHDVIQSNEWEDVWIDECEAVQNKPQHIATWSKTTQENIV